MYKVIRLHVAGIVGVAVALAAGGCVRGPALLQASRGRYNEVIQRTTDEQLLLNLVRLQYRDAPSFLEVGSVSTQFSLSQSANVAGLINEGPTAINPDRLDLRAGLDYEERPTVTLTPLQGKDFVRKLLTPLAPDVIVLLSQSGWSIDRVLRLTVQRMGGVDNASSASGPTPSRAPSYREFARISRRFRWLQEHGWLDLAYETRETPLFGPVPVDRVNTADVISASSAGTPIRLSEDGTLAVITTASRAIVWRIPPEAAGRTEVVELMEWLGLAPGRSSYELRVGTGGQGAIGLSMRSLMGTLFYLSQGVDVPPAHRARGLVTSTVDDTGKPFDWSQVTEGLLRVHWDAARPREAAVLMRRRGYWFYIDDTDLISKSTFALLGQLFALQAGGVETIGPVLTLPVGG